MTQATTTTLDTLSKTSREEPGAARRLFDAGFRDLISVIPPDVELVKRTKVKSASRGKVPGKRVSRDRWCGFPKWTKHKTTLHDAKTWDEWGSNIGLKGDQFPGLDLDTDDGPLSEKVLAFALENLGPCPEHRRSFKPLVLKEEGS